MFFDGSPLKEFISFFGVIIALCSFAQSERANEENSGWAENGITQFQTPQSSLRFTSLHKMINPRRLIKNTSRGGYAVPLIVISIGLRQCIRLYIGVPPPRYATPVHTSAYRYRYPNMGYTLSSASALISNPLRFPALGSGALSRLSG